MMNAQRSQARPHQDKSERARSVALRWSANPSTAPGRLFPLLFACAFPVQAQLATPDALVDRFVDAWNAHDPRMLDTVFDDDADWVTVSGERRSGRRAIQSFLAEEHGSWAASTRMSAGKPRVRALPGNGAVIYFDWEIGATGAQDVGAAFRGINIFVAERGPEGWRVVAGQATGARAGKPGR